MWTVILESAFKWLGSVDQILDLGSQPRANQKRVLRQIALSRITTLYSHQAQVAERTLPTVPAAVGLPALTVITMTLTPN